MFALFNAHPYHNRYSLGAIISGMSIFGMILTVVGLYHLNEVYDFIDVGVETYQMARAIMMSMILCLGVYALSRKAVMEGVVMILTGISNVVISISWLMGTENDLYQMDVLIGAGLLLVSIPFFVRKDYLLSSGTFILAIGTITYPFFSDTSELILGTASFITGLLYTAYGYSAWYSVCTRREKYPWQDDEKANSSRDACGTAGFLIMGILSILVGLYYLNQPLDMMVMDATSYNIAKILMAGMILYYAALAIKDGAITSGMMSLFFGGSTFTFSASALFQNTGGVEILDIAFGIGMLMAAIVSFKEKQTSSMLVGSLVFCAFTFYPFLSGDAVYYMVGVPILIVGFIMAINSARYIYMLEIQTYEDE